MEWFPVRPAQSCAQNIKWHFHRKPKNSLKVDWTNIPELQHSRYENTKMVILDWAAKDGRNIGYKCGSDRIGTFMSLPYLWSAAFAQLHKDISLQTSMLVEHDISQKWKHKVWSAVSINKSSCTSEIFVSFLLLTEWKFHANIQCGHPRAEMTFAVNNAMIWYHSKNGWPILEPGQLFLSIWPKWCISDRDKKVSLLREGLDWDEGLLNGIYEVEDMSTCPRTFRRMSKHPKKLVCLDVYI